MTDQHIVKQDEGCPELRVLASASRPQAFLSVDAYGMVSAFHISRSQAAQLRTALAAVETELAARDLATAAMAGQVTL